MYTEKNQDAIRAYIHYIRNVRNAAHVISEWACNHGEYSPDEITWAHVGTAEKVYNDLLEIASFCGLEVNEV